MAMNINNDDHQPPEVKISFEVDHAWLRIQIIDAHKPPDFRNPFEVDFFYVLHMVA